MATRANQSTQGPAAEAGPTSFVPAFARGSSGPSLGSVPLRLRGGRGPWTWMISQAKLGCRNGQIVPLAIPAWHAPGISANIRGDRGAGFSNQLQKQGYVEVSHGFAPDSPCFDGDRNNAEHSTYLAKWSGLDIEGRPATKWTDAWERPVQLGHIVQWERDEVGRDAFLVRALMEVANGGQPLTAAQIRLATAPIINRIHSEANRATERSRLLIMQCARHLPTEHIPDSVRQILQRQEIEMPTLKK